MIEVRNLVKKYGNHLAVDHLSFTVEQGQIYGFLGPNGAGKSTTMNIMTGYLGATEGEVLINGYDILKQPEKAKKCIGYLPEIPPLYVDMTVMEYLTFAAELKKIPKGERKEQIGKVIELTKLEDVEGRLIKNLSKGYKQRVGLAQAILGLPEIIILDEPTVGLDPKQIIEIRELIRELAKEHTVILSSHILAEISEVCDHIMIISKGKLVASDTPKNLEKLMSTTATIEIEARGTVGQVGEILAAWNQDAQFTCKEAEDKVVAEIHINGEDGLEESLFMAFAEAKCPLLALKKTEASLEEVFLKLTGESEDAEEEDEDMLEHEEEGVEENDSDL